MRSLFWSILLSILIAVPAKSTDITCVKILQRASVKHGKGTVPLYLSMNQKATVEYAYAAHHHAVFAGPCEKERLLSALNTRCEDS
jgi:hypothetical protein